MPNIVTLTCSPRANGNTENIGISISNQLNSTIHPTELISLRSIKIRPCISCDFCAKHPEQCSLEAEDEVGWLFDKVRSAHAFIIVSPIFFYGPPAQLKSFIDRAQTYWHASNYTFNTSESQKTFFKPAFVTLVAAKKNGPNIFEPSLIIIQCFLQSIGFYLQDKLLLRNLDGPQDFINSTTAAITLSSFIQKIQNTI